MAADLHIHVRTDDMKDRDFEIFFSNSLGSKYCHFPMMRKWDEDLERAAEKRIFATPNIWIGEVSWLKAALFEDGEETFIPDTVAKVQEIIGEDQPVIDEELIQKVMDAFTEKNKTQYTIAKPQEVWAFLESHKGKKAFTISW